ncbi:hypothetical protein FHY06_002709 [Variovorax sp. BK613]|uniref:IS66 family transposase n=1 Tax=Variovorax TaxID=34072 RepID=UPI0017A32B74|nr:MULTISPECIES: transposase [unclassified Variovorax]MBB3639591.1 hypothetical protein [Variovorax sp. BK613]
MSPFAFFGVAYVGFADGRGGRGGRGGRHARDFLDLPDEDGWRGTLVCDDFSGYKACFELGVTEAGRLAYARRKLHELWANHGSLAGEQALKFFGELYAVEREVADLMREERKRVLTTHC